LLAAGSSIGLTNTGKQQVAVLVWQILVSTRFQKWSGKYWL